MESFNYGKGKMQPLFNGEIPHRYVPVKLAK